MKPGTIKTYLSQPSYCGQKLKVRCEALSPVCRQFTLDPEPSVMHSYSFFGGMLGLIDMIVIVFAIGSKLPIASLLNVSSSAAASSMPTTKSALNADTVLVNSSSLTSTTPSSSGATSTIIDSSHLDVVSFINFMFASMLAFLAATVTAAKENPTFTILIIFLIVRSVYRIVTRVPAERLTAIRGVGLQLNKQNMFGTWSATELVDVATITSLVVNETFFRHRVIYCMAVACQDKKQLVLPFANTLPQLCVLRTILRGTRAVLYGEPEEGLSLADLETLEDEKQSMLSSNIINHNK